MINSEDGYKSFGSKQEESTGSVRNKIGNWDERSDQRGKNSFREVVNRKNDPDFYKHYDYKPKSQTSVGDIGDWTHDKFNHHERHFSDKDTRFRGKNSYKKNNTKRGKKKPKSYNPGEDFVVLNFRSKGKEQLSDKFYLPNFVDEHTLKTFEDNVKKELNKQNFTEIELQQLMIAIYAKICSKFKHGTKYYRRRMDGLINRFINQQNKIRDKNLPEMKEL